MSDDLLRLAGDLVPSGASRPRDVNLRRALSCAYYAMFHTVAQVAADTLIGSASADRTDRAWAQAYRSLNHRQVAERCEAINKKNATLGFPSAIVTFARQFPPAMKDRHAADYDPFFKPRKGTVLASINAAEAAIIALKKADLRHRRAFAAFVLFGQR